jgi:hypothetical protein
VEQFPDINKLCNVASCWIYEDIGILLGARPILHISRIKVNGKWLLCFLLIFSTSLYVLNSSVQQASFESSSYISTLFAGLLNKGCGRFLLMY